MRAVVYDPLAKLRVTVGLHNGSDETWRQFNAVIDEYAREGARKLPALRREVEDDGEVARYAARAIGRMGVAGWPTLKSLLTHPDDTVRHCAIVDGVAEFWGGWRWDEATLTECSEILARILQSDNPENRSAVLFRIGELVDITLAHPLFPIMIEVAEHEDRLGEEARATIVTLVKQGHLEDLADDPTRAAMLSAAYGRAQARPAGAIPGGTR
ncbi:MAG TPA: hypothetical protein VFZ25_00650 [Chloroflexota bacterium]|nr:hypothetical protein [Chloroflexota bacterium]